MHDSPAHTILNGATGIAGALISYLSTIVQDFTAWMQVLSFFAGIMVSILMCIKLWQDIKRKRNDR